MYLFLKMAVIFLSLKHKCKGSDNSVICKLINPQALEYLQAIMTCVAGTSKNRIYSYYGDVEGKNDPFYLKSSVHHQLYIKMDDMGALQK